MDREDQDGGKEVVGADQEGVFQHGPVGVADAGQQGKDVEQHDDIDHGRGNDHGQDQRPHHSERPRGAQTQMIEDVAVRTEKQPHAQQDQPEHGGLLEVLPEGAETLTGEGAVLLPHQL